MFVGALRAYNKWNGFLQMVRVTILPSGRQAVKLTIPRESIWKGAAAHGLSA